MQWGLPKRNSSDFGGRGGEGWRGRPFLRFRTIQVVVVWSIGLDRGRDLERCGGFWETQQVQRCRGAKIWIFRGAERFCGGVDYFLIHICLLAEINVRAEILQSIPPADTVIFKYRHIIRGNLACRQIRW